MTFHRSFSEKTIALIFIAMVLVGVGVAAAYYGVSHTAGGSHHISSTTSTARTTSFTSNNTTSNSSWASLQGVNYAWGVLGIQCCANPPSTDFPIMKNLGFNLIRVPLSWNTYEQNTTAYIGYVNQIADEADSIGMHIIYDGHTNGGNREPGFFFPASMSIKYGNDSTFFLNWWQGKVTYNGSSGWNAVWNDFWVPIIGAVSSHPSTFGYEIESEPQPDGAPLSDLQSYNQFIANHMQNTSSGKYIIFMGPYDSLTPNSDESVAPQGIANLVMDVHCYIGTDSQPGSCADLQQSLSSVSSVGSDLGIKILIGEWAICDPGGCTVQQSQATSIIQNYVNEFRQYGYANTYWAWKCDTDPASVGQTDLLTGYPGCNTYWLDTQISQVEG